LIQTHLVLVLLFSLFDFGFVKQKQIGLQHTTHMTLAYTNQHILDSLQ